MDSSSEIFWSLETILFHIFWKLIYILYSSLFDALLLIDKFLHSQAILA
jgi:hypothetical protein